MSARVDAFCDLPSLTSSTTLYFVKTNAMPQPLPSLKDATSFLHNEANAYSIALAAEAAAIAACNAEASQTASTNLMQARIVGHLMIHPPKPRARSQTVKEIKSCEEKYGHSASSVNNTSPTSYALVS